MYHVLTFGLSDEDESDFDCENKIHAFLGVQ